MTGHRQIPCGLIERIHQISDQTNTLVPGGRRVHRRFEAVGIPATPKATPIAVSLSVAAELGEKRRIPHGSTETAGIGEQPLPLIKARRRGFQMAPTDVTGILPENRRFKTYCAD